MNPTPHYLRSTIYVMLVKCRGNCFSSFVSTFCTLLSLPLYFPLSLYILRLLSSVFVGSHVTPDSESMNLYWKNQIIYASTLEWDSQRYFIDQLYTQ